MEYGIFDTLTKVLVSMTVAIVAAHERGLPVFLGLDYQ